MSQERIDRLKKKRATMRTMVTKLLHDVETLLSAEATSVGELEERLNIILGKERTLSEFNKEIEDVIEVDALEEELAGSESYAERIITAKTRLNRRIAGIGRASGQATVSSNSVNVRNAQASTQATVKLPKLELTKFSGERTCWLSFWDHYESAIHKNAALSNVDKFKYLKGCLTGKAQTAIDGVQITNENYGVAVDILRERFGRTELIVDEHMKRLLHLREVKDSKNVEGLRIMLDEIQTAVRSLETLGIETSAYGVLLLSTLKRSVPADINLEYHRSSKKPSDAQSTQTDELKAFLEFFKHEVESRERCQDESRSQNIDGGQNRSRQDKRIPSAAALAVGSEGSDFRCTFCGSSNHESKRCETPMSLNDRKAILARENRCFRCAKRNHKSSVCRNAKWLKCANCSGRHISPMCDPDWAKGEKENVTHVKGAKEGAGTVREERAEAKAALQSSLKIRNGKVDDILLQTVQVWAEGTKKRSLVRMLLDGGSQRTFVTCELSQRLSLRLVGEDDITIFTFGGNDAGEQRKCRRVELWLKSQHDQKAVRIEALEVPKICSDVVRTPANAVVNHLHGHGIILADSSSYGTPCENGIGILIGSDCYWAVVTGKLKRLSKTLVATETIFGWALQGPTETKSAAPVSAVGVMKVAVTSTADEELSAQLRSFWELEHLGVVDKTTTTNDEQEVLTQFEQTIKFDSGRYQVSFPWNEKAERLADNKETAWKRLKNLTARLLRDEQLMKEYDAAIRQYVEGDFAETAPAVAQGPVYYMPHQAVIRRDKQTTKLRVVFDASSSAEGCLSLNDALVAGPNLNPNLIDLLLKFRTHRIAILADIEKAFLQVSLLEKDRDALRFLWYEETPRSMKQLPPTVTWRMKRVPFGAASSPFLLAATIRHHVKSLQEKYPMTAEILLSHMYVDDLVSGANSLEEAGVIYNEARAIMSKAHMRLRKWVSNDERLLQRFRQDEEAATPPTETQMIKVLGVAWNSHADSFGFSIKGLESTASARRNSKRFVLQSAARLYDPFGFLSPAVTKVKILFQMLWKRGLGWDEELPTDISDIWQQWYSELPCLQDVAVPRRLADDLSDKETTKTLHIFCDASPQAYGTVSYLRTETPHGDVKVTLVMAKARVAPLKKLSLPRLELMGALLGTRLLECVQKALDATDFTIYLWSD